MTGVSIPFVSFQVMFTSLERQNKLGKDEVENFSLHAPAWSLGWILFAGVPQGAFPLQALAVSNKHLRHIIP